jgi:hypothetical protein
MPILVLSVAESLEKGKIYLVPAVCQFAYLELSGEDSLG